MLDQCKKYLRSCAACGFMAISTYASAFAVYDNCPRCGKHDLGHPDTELVVYHDGKPPRIDICVSPSGTSEAPGDFRIRKPGEVVDWIFDGMPVKLFFLEPPLGDPEGPTLSPSADELPAFDPEADPETP